MAATKSYPSVSKCFHSRGIAYSDKDTFLVHDKNYSYPEGGIEFNFCPHCGVKFTAQDLIQKGGGSCVECVDSE